MKKRLYNHRENIKHQIFRIHAYLSYWIKASYWSYCCQQQSFFDWTVFNSIIQDGFDVSTEP